MGPEKASLHRVVWKFQRTRVLMDIVANILCIVMAAVGPVSGTGPCAAALSPRSPADKEWHQLLSVRAGGFSPLSLSRSSSGANVHKANPCRARRRRRDE